MRKYIAVCVDERIAAVIAIFSNHPLMGYTKKWTTVVADSTAIFTRDEPDRLMWISTWGFLSRWFTHQYKGKYEVIMLSEKFEFISEEAYNLLALMTRTSTALVTEKVDISRFDDVSAYVDSLESSFDIIADDET